MGAAGFFATDGFNVEIFIDLPLSSGLSAFIIDSEDNDLLGVIILITFFEVNGDGIDGIEVRGLFFRYDFGEVFFGGHVNGFVTPVKEVVIVSEADADIGGADFDADDAVTLVKAELLLLLLDAQIMAFSTLMSGDMLVVRCSDMALTLPRKLNFTLASFVIPGEVSFEISVTESEVAGGGNFGSIFRLKQ